VSTVGKAPLEFARIVVIGGGCYGSWYAQQLSRARQRGALSVSDIVVVDRDPACRVAERLAAGAYGDAPIRLKCANWSDYLAQWLSTGAEALRGHAMVPSPLMPHLCLDWLVERARARWPMRTVTVEPLQTAPPTPWQRGAPDGRHYVSFATWMCPVNCIEPATCPATRGPRDWSMPAAMSHFADQDPSLGRSVIFHCEHRTYGVGMIDADAIAIADQQVAEWGATHPTTVLVGTVSHCHGALGVLAVA
jgi:hypothetical protein